MSFLGPPSNQTISLSGIYDIPTYSIDYSYIKDFSIKIIENYLNRKQMKDREQCIRMLRMFDDILIHDVVVFLNDKKRKKSLLKYLTQVRKTVLDTPTYVY